MRHFILALFLLIAVVAEAYAQSMETTTIHWNSVSTFDVNMGTWTEEATTLTLYGRDRLEWKNQDGSVRKTFLVNEIMGEWTTIETAGQVQYEFTEGNNNGTATIIRSGQSTKALIVIASEEPQSFELTIVNP